MPFLLKLSTLIDQLNRGIGRSVSWCILLAAIVGAGNAIFRKFFDLSSNAWLEIQWWLFSTAFLFASSWTLQENVHVRIDVAQSMLSLRIRNVIEILGHLLFLLPTTLLLLITSFNYFSISWIQNEQSKDAGGLPQWPIKAIIPLAFGFLLLQAISEIIKQIARMRGIIPPIDKKDLEIRE